MDIFDDWLLTLVTILARRVDTGHFREALLHKQQAALRDPESVLPVEATAQGEKEFH